MSISRENKRINVFRKNKLIKNRTNEYLIYAEKLNKKLKNIIVII